MEMQQETIEVKPNGKVVLTLPEGKDYKQIRTIGFIRDRTFQTFRKSSNQYFKNLNAIGLNFKLISQGEKYFDWIKIEFDFEIIETSREFFLEFGEFKHFKKNNLDKQLFLNLDLFGLDKVNNWIIEKANRQKTKEKSFKKSVIQLAMF